MRKLMFVLFFCAVNTLIAQNITPVVTSDVYSSTGKINPKEDWIWYFYSESVDIVSEGEVYKIRNGFWITPTEFIYPYGKVSVYKDYVAWQQQDRNWCVTIRYTIKKINTP